jgi:transcriptional regulator with XRE-family HTH domain
MMKRVALGEAIKAIREARAAADPKFRGSTFAITCLMSHAHLVNIEKGRKQPGEELLHRIAAHLGVSVNAISYVVSSEGVA